MRDIKVRVWDKINKKMVLPIKSDVCYNPTFVLSTTGYLILIGNNGYCVDQECCGEHEEYYSDESENFEIMIYTGLKDKNGIDIYEGDLVKHCKAGIVEVKWILCEFVYQFKDDGGFGREEEIKYIGSNCEVVGNIYEGINNETK